MLPSWERAFKPYRLVLRWAIPGERQTAPLFGPTYGATVGPRQTVTAMKMKDIIGPMMKGPFTSGQEWMIKALHPADPLTEIRGIPDQSSMATTCVNWQMSVAVAPNVAATGTWACDIALMPDPVQFAQTIVTDSVGARYAACLNSSLTGSGYTEKFNALVTQAERWRLAYAGVTIYHDAPALSNQGTVAAAIVPVEPTLLSVASCSPAGPCSDVYAARRAITFQQSDLPVFEATQRMPNAYFGQSKDGVYMPLKLSTNHQQWHSTADSCLDATGWTSTSGVCSIVPTSAAPVAPLFPYAGSESYCTYRTAATNQIDGNYGRRCYPCNENWGHICFANMAVASRLVLHFRFGFEMQVNPLSSLAPYLKLSPPYDRAAIDEYFAIARELKDAYPADYNDWGKLWNVIKGAAKVALPAIGMMGPVGAAISGVGGAILNALESKGGPSNTGVPRDSPPAAQTERAQAILTSPLTPLVLANARPKVKRAARKIAQAGLARGQRTRR